MGSFEGVNNEFFRIPGLHENVLEVVFIFRKIVIYAPNISPGEIIFVPFSFSGQGTFYAADLPLPVEVKCINKKVPIFTISPGSSVRGFILIQKITETYIKKEKFKYFGEPWSFTIEFIENEEKKKLPFKIY